MASASIAEFPVKAEAAATLLNGTDLGDAAIAEAADVAATREIDPPSDIHASAAFRRHLAAVLTRRALTAANRRAGVLGAG